MDARASVRHWGLGLALLLFWTAAVAVSLYWDRQRMEEAVLEQARRQAEAALDTQAAVRHFVTRVGGIYVDAARGVAPNPHLAHLPERDVRTPTGRHLTLVNSSYLIRLIDEIGTSGPAIHVRTTALHPLSPLNRPDAWERMALARLHDGRREWGEVVSGPQGRWWREVRARIATQACLACHKRQGVRPGQMLGALSVRVPLAPLRATLAPQWHALLTGHLAFWSLGCLGILWTLRQLHRWRLERVHMQQDLERELANERALSEILTESLSKRPFEARIARILEITTHAPVADLDPKGAVFLMDEQQQALRLVAQSGLPPPLLESCAQVPLGRCLCGRAALTREVIFAGCVDARHETRYTGMQEHGHYCVPIQHGRRLLGVFTLYVAHGHQRNPSEERFLQTVADILGNLIDRHLAYQALQQQAFHDALTGLPNRALFMDRARQHLEEECKRRPVLSAVLFLDLDGFKEVNDRLGHEAGDRLLVEAGQRITGCVRGTDTVARLGGDEFIVLLREIGTPEVAQRIADQIHQVLARPFRLDGRTVQVSASIGIAFNARRPVSPDTLVRQADTAMYRAKTTGKHRTVLFTEPSEASGGRS